MLYLGQLVSIRSNAWRMTVARYRIAYTSYPNCPEATEYSRSRAVSYFTLGGFTILIIIASAVWFIIATGALFSGKNYIQFLQSFFSLNLSAALALYTFVLRFMITERNCKIIVIESQKQKINGNALDFYIKKITSESKTEQKTVSIKFFLVFYCIVLFTIGIIGIIKGLDLLLHKNSGSMLLIISIIFVFVVEIVSWIVYKKTKRTMYSHQESDFTQFKSQNVQIESSSLASSITSQVLFCNKCGYRLDDDSIFCAKCGCRIETT